MTIPFLNLFKRKTEKAPAAPAAPAPRPVVEKPSGERLSKTVLPSANRSVAFETSFSGAAARSMSGGSASAVAPPPAPAMATTPGGRVPFSLSTGGLPPAVALALEPKVERAISLELADVVAQMPEGLVRPLQEGDAKRRVLLKAAEIEKGMSSGKPAVSVASIFEQVPEIFLHKIPSSDSRQVQLPLPKVLEQFSKLQLRNDQYRDQVVPQVETPFLQLTVEDNTRFGIPMEPIQTGELPPVRMQLATAEALAAAQPEATILEKVELPPPPRELTPLRATAYPPSTAKRPVVSRASVPAPTPVAPPAITPAPAPEKTAPPAPARIPFKLTPNGTDEPNSERVPASSGPSVPTSAPPAPAPMRIDFTPPPPPVSMPQKPEPWLTKENFEKVSETMAPAENFVPPPAPEFGKQETRITLPLKPILQTLSPLQITGDVAAIPDDAKLDLPFSIVEPQLLTGRVSLTPEQFAAALPEAHRGIFNARNVGEAVALPLQDVLKNLPAAALRIRQDQVAEEKGGNFVTPFSAKAEEDAKRLQTPDAPVLPIAPAPKAPAQPAAPARVPFSVKAPAPVAPTMPEPAVVGRDALQKIFETDENLDAKGVIAQIEKLPGVKACAIMFADGLTLAGGFPEEYCADGLCAMAPSLLERVKGHVAETKLGELRAFTFCCAEAAVAFFLHDNLCLATLHAPEGLAADLRERLARALEELSRKYSHPA